MPKSILRTSNIKTHGRTTTFADDDLSLFSSILSGFKPPFMRKMDGRKHANVSISEHADDRDDNITEKQDLLPSDESEVSSTACSDERLNMSVAFDHMRKDDISTGVTFDLDHKLNGHLPSSTASLEPIDQSLEITIENYVEYEELKRKRSRKGNIGDEPSSNEGTAASTDVDSEEDFDGVSQVKLEKELESLRLLKEQVEQEKLMQIMKAKREEEIKQQKFLEKVRKEAELVEKLKKRVADVRESARARKVEAELSRVKEEINKRKADRIPATPKVQERLQSTVDRIAAANTAQDLLTLDVAKIVARASKRESSDDDKLKIITLTDDLTRLLPPPPVVEKMKLANDYQYNDDIDPEPINQVERLTYGDSFAIESSCATLDSSYGGSSLGILTRPGYIKPAPTSPRGMFF